MAIERTFAIIKPDAVEKNYTGKILAHIDAAGFKIVGIKKLHLTRAHAEGFYAEHKARGFFDELVTVMSRSPVVVLALEAAKRLFDRRNLTSLKAVWEDRKWIGKV